MFLSPWPIIPRPRPYPPSSSHFRSYNKNPLLYITVLLSVSEFGFGVLQPEDEDENFLDANIVSQACIAIKPLNIPLVFACHVAVVTSRSVTLSGNIPNL